MRRHSYFSLEEANALLPTLEHFFRELALVRRELLDVREALARHGATVHPEGIALPRMAKKSGKTLVARYQRLCEDYDVLMEELVGLGVELV
ncbi:MAG: DUF2203 family protein, partial [Deltaproteobacteria bacterium]|nr:DUF2203 family protein [Deltaproteobacteria bacterium]